MELIWRNNKFEISFCFQLFFRHRSLFQLSILSSEFTRGQLERELELKEQQLALEEQKEELRKLKELNKCIAEANNKLVSNLLFKFVIIWSGYLWFYNVVFCWIKSNDLYLGTKWYLWYKYQQWTRAQWVWLQLWK